MMNKNCFGELLDCFGELLGVEKEYGIREIVRTLIRYKEREPSASEVALVPIFFIKAVHAGNFTVMAQSTLALFPGYPFRW